MRKSVILAAVLTLFAATGAMAEGAKGHEAGGHKLLVTDVPDPGQVEARMDYIYSYAEGKNELGEKVKDEKSVAAMTLAAGVVKGLKLSVSMPYTFVQHEESTKIDGFGDLVLGARYSLAKGGLHLPVDLALGLDWQLNSASTKEGKPGSGVNTYSPYVAASKNMGMVIPYVKYQPDFAVKDGRDQTRHNMTVGAEIEFSHKVSLDASVKTTVNGSFAGIRSTTNVEFELTPYISLCKNAYLLPRVAYKVGDDNTKGALVKGIDEIKTGLGVYFIF